MKILKYLLVLLACWVGAILIMYAINSKKIAVVVTDWGQPEGFSDSYYQGIAQRSRIGIQASSVDETCTENFVGFPNLGDSNSLFTSSGMSLCFFPIFL